MSAPDGIWFIYRSPDEGPLSKRVRRLAAPSVLAWFQAQIEEARTSLAPQDVAREALGGVVPGLAALFEAAHKLSLHTPKTTTALRKLLAEHGKVTGAGEDHVQLDAHSLRALSGAEGGKGAFYFFDDEAALKSADRVAYLLHHEPRLPEGEAGHDGGDPQTPGPAGGSFTPPVDVSLVAPAASPPTHPEGATYAILLGIPEGVTVSFPGVRLPELIAHVRAAAPDSAPATLLQVLLGEPSASVPEGAHVATVGAPAWILFDDRWAEAHPDLAASILRLGRHWDPFAALRAPKASKPPPSAKEPKPAKAPKSIRVTRASAAAEAAATKHDHAWKSAVAGRTEGEARAYAPTERFAEGELIHHTKFGLGVVVQSDPTKLEAIFAGTPRILVQGATKL